MKKILILLLVFCLFSLVGNAQVIIGGSAAAGGSADVKCDSVTLTKVVVAPDTLNIQSCWSGGLVVDKDTIVTGGGGGGSSTTTISGSEKTIITSDDVSTTFDTIPRVPNFHLVIGTDIPTTIIDPPTPATYTYKHGDQVRQDYLNGHVIQTYNATSNIWVVDIVKDGQPSLSNKIGGGDIVALVTDFIDFQPYSFQVDDTGNQEFTSTGFDLITTIDGVTTNPAEQPVTFTTGTHGQIFRNTAGQYEIIAQTPECDCETFDGQDWNIRDANGKKYVKVTSDDIEVINWTTDTTGVRHIFGNNGGTTDPDDFWKVTRIDHFEGEFVTPASDSVNYTAITGAWTTGTPSNHYATATGATFTATFTGTGAIFNFLSEQRSAIWTIEGSWGGTVIVDSYSNPTIVTKSVELVSGLEFGTYSITATVTGRNAASPSTRGYVYVGTNPFQTHTLTILGAETPQLNQIDNVFAANSNIDFALSNTPNSASAAQWFPNHNNIATAFFLDDGYRKVIIDNQELTGLTDWKQFRNIEIEQLFYATHPETGVQKNMRQFHKYKIGNAGHLHTLGDLEFLVDQSITGYIGMLPVVAANTKETYSTFAEEPISFLPLDDSQVNLPESSGYTVESNFGRVGMVVNNYCQATRSCANDSRDAYLWKRSNGFPKIYQKSYLATPIKAGEKIQYSLTHFFEANKKIEGNVETLASVLNAGNNAEGQEIKNAADPTLPQSLATKNYVDDAVPNYLSFATVADAQADPNTSSGDYVFVLVGMDDGTGTSVNVPTLIILP